MQTLSLVLVVTIAQWPADVAMPAGMKAYTGTRLTQRIAITDNRPSHKWYDLDTDDVFGNAPTLFNPNRKVPWRVSGGMEGLTGWKSTKMTNFDPKTPITRREAIPIKDSGQSLPGFRWSYPDGTVFADVLSNDRGEVFELRTRTKTAGKWVSVVELSNDAAAPAGYKGAGRCASCHDHAGSSQQYGIMVRGNDGVFSFLPK